MGLDYLGFQGVYHELVAFGSKGEDPVLSAMEGGKTCPARVRGMLHYTADERCSVCVIPTLGGDCQTLVGKWCQNVAFIMWQHAGHARLTPIAADGAESPGVKCFSFVTQLRIQINHVGAHYKFYL
jgi:hypothetical protein